MRNKEAVSKIPLHVFLLIGGINMEGRGEISQSDRNAVDGTLIWDSQYATWRKCPMDITRPSSRSKIVNIHIGKN
jgi:hypothetical protein